MAAAGAAAGLPPDLAMRLARATVAGAGALADASPEPAERLRVDVTSPGGTTAAGLAVLMPELPDLMTRTVAAAAGRSRELAE
jgi:pyrroline-5-carboxylate reductase